MKPQLKVSDTYEIVASSIFNDYDRKVLLRLYQPIIGYEAVILYLNLWSELEGDQTISRFEKSHERLTEMMQCAIKIIEESLKKLEAIGLVQTLISLKKGKEHFVYQLFAPKTPNSFYHYDVLDVLLRNNLSSIEYDRTKQYFTQVYRLDEKEYQDVSANFLSVFKVQENHQNATNNRSSLSIIRDHQEGTIVLPFDFDALQEKLIEYQISVSRFSNEEKQIISSLAYAYDLTMVDLRTLIVHAYDPKTNKLDCYKLKTNARKLTKAPKITTSAPTTVAPIATGNDEYDQKLRMFQELSPIEFLRFRNNNQPVLEADAYLISDIKSKTSLSDAVINVILDYTLHQNENRLPKSYVQKIASSLVRSKITDDAYQAMIYLNKDFRRPASKNPTPVVASTNDISEEDFAKALADVKKIKG